MCQSEEADRSSVEVGPHVLELSFLLNLGKETYPAKAIAIIAALTTVPQGMLQVKLMNLSYKIFECVNEDRAKHMMKSSVEMIGQLFAPNARIAEALVKMLPGVEAKDIEQATGLINIYGESVLISRRLLLRAYLDVQGPDENKGGLALDYLMMWQHGSMLFSVFEPNVVRIWQGQTRMGYGKIENVQYDAQVLTNALTTFQDNQLFEKGLTMLKYFVDSKQFLTPH